MRKISEWGSRSIFPRCTIRVIMTGM
jgi:hypothetical protein